MQVSQSCFASSKSLQRKVRGGSRTAVTSNMERYAIIVNAFQPLTISAKRSILDVVAVLDLPLKVLQMWHEFTKIRTGNNSS